MYRTITLIGLLGSLPFAAFADDTPEARERIASRFPGTEAADVIPSPVAGLYEVTVGPIVIYVTEDGRYMFRGNLLDMKTDTDLTEARESRARVKVLADLSDDELITFGPDDPKHTVTVFTDTSCTYCRELHRQIAAYNDLGIKVRYALYPRNGMASGSWRAMERVACAKDRKVALTAAKNDDAFDSEPCDTSIVMDQWQLGRMLGIRGTPAIFTESGQMIPGYLPPKQLLKALDQRQAGR